MFKYFSIGSLVISLLSCEKNSAIIRNPDYFISESGVSIPVYSYLNFSNYLESKNDSTYVINFWATWCKPCVEELPYFQKSYELFKGQKVHFIFVSLDFEKSLKTKLLPFISKNKLIGEHVVLKQDNMNDWISKIDENWDGAIPMTIIYKKDKRSTIVGETDDKIIKQHILNTLK